MYIISLRKLISVDGIRPSRFLLADLCHVNLNTIRQHSGILFVINESILLKFLLRFTCVGIAFDAGLIVVFTFVTIGINVAIGAPRSQKKKIK